MKDIFEHKFAIKRLSKETDTDYLQAFRIYNDTTPVEIKTATNEIVHWLKKDNINTSFKIFLFALYLDDKVIGFSMISYILSEKVSVIEYLALKPQYRINSAFYSYIGLLQDYLRDLDIEVSYYITDISNKGEGKKIDKESRLLRKLLCLEGFGRINTKYYTPPLGIINYESDFESFLYIKSNDTIKQISNTTYQNIIRAIYYNYYYEWYKDFLLNPKDIDEYKMKLDGCLAFINKNIGNNMVCEIVYAECPLVSDISTDEKTYGHLPLVKKNKNIRLFFFIPLLLAIPVCIILVYKLILETLNIEFDSVSTIISGYFTAIITAISTYFITKRKS